MFCKRNFKLCFVFYALLLSALVCVYIVCLSNVQFGKLASVDSKQEYTMDKYTALSKNSEKEMVNAPLPVPLAGQTLGEINQAGHLKDNTQRDAKPAGPLIDNADGETEPVGPLIDNTYGEAKHANRVLAYTYGDVKHGYPLKSNVYDPVQQFYSPTPKTYSEARKLLKDYVFDDIMNMKPIRYLENFKNPCWLGSEDNGPIHDNKIHCLPYFFVIALKAYDPRKLSFYIHMFDFATETILSDIEGHGNAILGSNLITGEGTPANLHMQGLWDLLPGNKGLSEPKYTNVHYIKHLIPQAKIIIIFRNPVDRLYSDFLHHAKIKNATLFHQQAAAIVDVYRTCFKQHSFRQCIYNHSITDVHPTIFTPAVGFYSFFMKELRSVFSPNQILPLLFDDYVAKPLKTMSKVYSFLELRGLGHGVLENIVSNPVKNSGAERTEQSGPMLDNTRTLLEDFYRSSNIEMAELMGDNRFLFSSE